MIILPGRSSSWTPAGGPTYGNAVSVDLGNSTTVGTTPTIGAVNGGYDNWTQQSGTPNFTVTNLQDDTGAATTIDLQLSTASGNRTTRATNDSSDEYNMYVRGFGVEASSATTLAITQITSEYTKYDIVLYYDETSGLSTSGTVTSFSDGTTTYYAQADETAGWDGSFVQLTETGTGGATGGNYIHWTGLTAASVTISMQCDFAAHHSVSGLQIIERTD